MQQSITFRLMNSIEGVGAAGQVITMALDPQSTYTTQELDTWLASYTQSGMYRAEEVTQPELVDKETAKLRYFTKANTFRRVNVNTSLMGAINEVDPETELKDVGPFQHRALGSFVPAFTTSQQGFDVRSAAAARIREALDLDFEYRLWTLLTTSGSWSSNNRTTLTSGLQWGGTSGVGASSDPVADIMNCRLKSAAPITDWYMNEEVAGWFVRHSKVRDHMRQMLGDSAPTPQIVTAERSDFEIPGLGRFHVANARVLNETTNALDEILNDTVIGLRLVSGGQMRNNICSVKTFRTRGPSGTGWISRSIPIGNRGYGGGELLVVGCQDDIFMVSDCVGVALFDVLQ